MARLLAYDVNGNVVQFEADAIPASGNPFKIDSGGATGKAGTASAGAATLNRASGLITTEALTTAAGADYTLTLTDSAIQAGDVVFATVANGTNSAGTPTLGTVAASAGLLVIKVHNSHASAAFNGTLKIGFMKLSL